MAMFGREAQLPLDLIYGGPRVQNDDQNSSQTKSLREKLETIFDFIRTNQRKSIKRQINQYKQEAIGYEVGEKVWLFTPTSQKNKGRKLSIH